MDQFDVAPGHGHEMLEIVTIRRNDFVVVSRQEHDRRVNDIGEPRRTEQLAGGTAEGFVQRPDVDTLDGS